MRDGVELLADHYAPTSETTHGTILLRSPYGRSAAGSLDARLFAARGYHVVFQSCRGTFGSGGTFEPMVREVDDGHDTVEWLRGQPWFDGRLATMGLSYLGFTQWALLMDPPPELRTAVIRVGPHDFSEVAYGSGAFSLNDFLGWSDMVARQEDQNTLRSLIGMATASRRLKPGFDELPLADAAETVLHGRAPWYLEWLSHPDRSDAFWARMQLGAALDNVQVPVALVGGWQDLFLDQTLAQYAHLHRRGINVALTIGPWTHFQVAVRGLGLLTRETLDWLGEHLAGRASARREPVRVFVTGAEEWRDLPEWPLETREQVLYLAPGGQLTGAPPGPDAGAAIFTYHPSDPTPTVGGRLLSGAGGRRNQRDLEQRGDVMTFTGPLLLTDLEVLGTPVVELAHTSDNPHADVFVRLCEVDAKGRSWNVSDTLVRLDPGAATPRVLRLELDSMAHRFRAGSRLRLQVAGGSHPRFARNPGTGELPAVARGLVPSQRTIVLGGGESRLLLPIRSGW